MKQSLRIAARHLDVVADPSPSTVSDPVRGRPWDGIPRGWALASLALNVALGLGWFATSRGTPDSVPVFVGASPKDPGTAVEPARDHGRQGSPAWASVRSDDFRVYLGNLRQLGMPEALAKACLLTEIRSAYDAKRREVLGASSPFLLPPRRLAQLADEEDALVAELLGEEALAELRSPAGTSEDLRRLAFLPESSARQVMEIERRYQSRTEAISEAAQGFETVEDIRAGNALARERDGEIARILGPEAMEDYLAHTSDTASQMHAEGFAYRDMTEFKAVLNLRRRMQETMESITSEGRSDPVRVAELSEPVEAEIRGLLGDDRYADYQLRQESEYQELRALCRRYELDESIAAKAYALANRSEAPGEAAGEEAASGDASAEEASVLAETALAELLGADAYRSYRNRW